MKTLLPIELWCVASAETSREWISFRLPVIGVTAQQIWLHPRMMEGTPVPCRRIPRRFLTDAGPWSPTIWFGPEQRPLVEMALASWHDQVETAIGRVAALVRLREFIG